MSKAASESVESVLLTAKENKLVVHILGKGRKSLATAVAQVYLALPSDRTQWTKLGTGVVCLVKDKQEKSFFIRLLDIKERCVVWEQELYKQFKYRAVSKHFQTFFAHDCRAGINFSCTEEAALFRAAIMERVNVFKKKRDEIRQKKLVAYQQQQMSYQLSALQAMHNPYFMMQNPYFQNLDYRIQSMLMMQNLSSTVATSQRPQLQAMFNSMPLETRQAFLMNMHSGGSAMIGQPTMSAISDNRHQSQFAVPSTTGHIPQVPTAPIPQEAPAAQALNEQQVEQASKKTSSVESSPTTVPSPTTATPSTTQAPPPPPNVPLSSPSDMMPPPPPNMALPPTPNMVPPPPSNMVPPPPSTMAPTPPSNMVPPPPNAAPPPPPIIAPPPPSIPKLPADPSNAPNAPPSCTGDRSGLLQSIQAGKKLRKVGESNSRKAIPKVESGMRGALARALDNRAKVLGDEDSDSDDDWDDDDDDDWSD